MGGVAKGLLPANAAGSAEAAREPPIVLRTKSVLEEERVPCVLVGRHAAYAPLSLPTLDDDPSATGPLAGLLALLAFAEREKAEHVLAIACDMPLIRRDLVHRLVTESKEASVLATKRGAFWDPFFARYAPSLVLPIARSFAAEGGKKLQLLLDRAGALALPLSPEEASTLVDWDTPEDRERACENERLVGRKPSP